ncbi:LppX_LprAFG lipoprotein [Mycobacterium sp.]|uniref:LppX_LprAFG lipoprotein n=1 Tax=Mycobacterium sp. TaxID=1785 RepID=UPI002EFEA1E0
MNGLKSQAQSSHRRLSRRPLPTWSVATLVAATVFATVVTGCGSKSSTPSETTGASGTTATSATATTPGEPLPEASKILQASAKTTQTLHSVHIALTTTNLPDLPMETVNADVTNLPQGSARAVGDAKVRTQPNAPVNEFSFVVTDKTLYTKGADGKYTSMGPAQKIYDPGIVLSKDKGLAHLIEQVQNPKVDGRETINGIVTIKVSGTIDAAVIDPIVPQLGKDGGTLPITLWIADVPASATPTTTLPSDAPSPGTGPNLVRFMVNKDPGNVEVTLSNWAKPVDIPNPTG